VATGRHGFAATGRQERSMIGEFSPPPEAVQRIVADVAAYEADRKIAHQAVRWRVPVVMGSFVALAAAAVAIDIWFTRGAFLDNRYQWIQIALGLGIFLGGIEAYKFARKPAVIAQEKFRSRLLPMVFGFVENLRHGRGMRPDSFAGIPQEVTGHFNREEFDDYIAGRWRDLDFELCEARLRYKAGKSTSEAFRGVIVSFPLARPFAGKLIVTRQIGSVSRFFRDAWAKQVPIRPQSGDAEIDKTFEFRTDNEAATRELFGHGLPKALKWLLETWPQAPARLALTGARGYLLLPGSDAALFELPDISAPLDYNRHVTPIVADLGRILAIARLVRDASQPG
jgi:hypothetical protein